MENRWCDYALHHSFISDSSHGHVPRVYRLLFIQLSLIIFFFHSRRSLRPCARAVSSFLASGSTSSPFGITVALSSAAPFLICPVSQLKARPHTRQKCIDIKPLSTHRRIFPLSTRTITHFTRHPLSATQYPPHPHSIHNVLHYGKFHVRARAGTPGSAEDWVATVGVGRPGGWEGVRQSLWMNDSEKIGRLRMDDLTSEPVIYGSKELEAVWHVKIDLQIILHNHVKMKRSGRKEWWCNVM